MKKLIGVVLFIAAVAPAHAAQPAPLVKALLKQAPGLRAEVLKLALEAKARATDEGLVTKKNLLTVIDYSLQRRATLATLFRGGGAASEARCVGPDTRWATQRPPRSSSPRSWREWAAMGCFASEDTLPLPIPVVPIPVAPTPKPTPTPPPAPALPSDIVAKTQAK
jgi:hypothetical protein